MYLRQMNSLALETAVPRRRLTPSDKGHSPLILVERRSKVRYPIIASAQCRGLKGRVILGSGQGTIRNISSEALMIETECSLADGGCAEVAITWPVLLDGQVNLRLLVVGRVLRIGDGCAAIAIEKYEYRTFGNHAASGRKHPD